MIGRLNSKPLMGPLAYWPNSKYKRTLPEDPDELEDLITDGVDSKTMVVATAAIESFIAAMARAVGDNIEIHHDRLVSLEDSIETMIGMVQTLKARVGSTIDIGEFFSAPTLGVNCFHRGRPDKGL